MYLEGYDLRHFLVTCSAPVASRLLLCGYFLGRRFVDPDYRSLTDATARRGARTLEHPTLGRLTLYADALACAANAGKVALYQGNPSALNLGQWMALLRSAAKHLNGQLETPTEILLDRSAANEKELTQRWATIRRALELEGLDPLVSIKDAF
jgi:hypothetical protein